jgi:hypothetical protein
MNYWLVFVGSRFQLGKKLTNHKTERCFVAAFLLLFASMCHCVAQTSTGQIVGHVIDASGAVVPDVNVSAKNTATGFVRSTITNSIGAYTLTGLPPGSYEISAEKAGFEKNIITGIILKVDQELDQTISLSVGQVSQQVTVQSQALALDVDNPSLGQVITTQQVLELPLDGRGFLQLAGLSAGTTDPGNGQGDSQTGFVARNNVMISVAGQREQTSDIRIDGIPSKEFVYGPIGLQLSIDAIAEFNVQEGFGPPDQGVAGRINTVTKSGTNSFHGSAFEFLRNDVLDARSYFETSTKKLPFQQNQFGGSAGGPILKDKLLVFGDYEGLRVRQPTPGLGTVPLPAELTGDFSSVTTPIIDPSTGLPFPGNMIPTTRISNFAAKYNALIPAPNTIGTANRIVSLASNRNDDQGTLRVDYNPSTNNSIFGRYTRGVSSILSGGFAPYSDINRPLNADNVAVAWTHIFTPSLLNSFKVGLNRVIFNPFLPETPPADLTSTALGFTNITSLTGCSAAPAVGMAGFSGFGSTTLCIILLNNNYHYIDSLSWDKGHHRANVGFELIHIFSRQSVGVNAPGSLSFTGQFTGNSVADYLLGIPFSASAQNFSRKPDTTGLWPAIFASDEYQVLPTLTLNFGLRWEYFKPLASKDHSLASFYPNIPGGGWLYEPGSGLGNIGTIGPSGLLYPDYTDFAPRVGLAYKATDKLSVRSSYGIFYQTPPGNQYEFQDSGPPFVQSSALVSSTAKPTLFIDAGGFFPPQPPPYSGANVSGFGYDVHARTAYLQTWTLSLQQQLSGNFMVEEAYIGSKGTHLDKREDINRATTPPPLGYTGDLQAFRPFPDFNSMLFIHNNSPSNYNALQLKLNGRLRRLALLGSYTWSRSMDGDSYDNKACRCYVYGQADYARSQFDQRQRFSFSLVYQIPPAPVGNALVKSVIDNWEVTGITTLGSGFPFSINTSVDYSNRPSVYGWNEATKLCNGNLSPGKRKPSGWFDTSCFAAPALSTLGNSGFNNLDGPGLINQDLGVFRNFKIHESLNFQFRGEFFDIFNHPAFEFPDRTLEDSTFGQVLSSLPGRQVQFAGKLTW